MRRTKRRVECALLLLAGALSTPVMAAGQETPSTASSDPTRFRLLVNGAYNATTRSFAEAATFTAFLEQGSSRRDYDGGTGFVFEVGGIYSIAASFGVMGTFELFNGDNDVAFQRVEPHPLFFGRDRRVEGSEGGLSYKERALHLGAVYSHELSSFTVDLFGGPSFFFTETELLTDITTSSAYPFDELILERTRRAQFEDNPVGFHVGGALTFRLTRLLGIAFQARYCRATVSLQRDGAESLDFDAGGFRIGGGVRLAF